MRYNVNDVIIYVQTDGKAIGSKLGMNYACTYLEEWERELLQHSDQYPFSYWRYVDNVWALWIHGENSLYNFVSVVNSIHPRIKLELRYSTDSIEFLGVRTSPVNGYLKTDLFMKETGKHQYLHISSNHPKPVKEYIPYGLGLRVKRICSDQSDYQKRKRDLKGYQVTAIIYLHYWRRRKYRYRGRSKTRKSENTEAQNG
jgi:hypothetical protein